MLWLQLQPAGSCLAARRSTAALDEPPAAGKLFLTVSRCDYSINIGHSVTVSATEKNLQLK